MPVELWRSSPESKLIVENAGRCLFAGGCAAAGFRACLFSGGSTAACRASVGRVHVAGPQVVADPGAQVHKLGLDLFVQVFAPLRRERRQTKHSVETRLPEAIAKLLAVVQQPVDTVPPAAAVVVRTVVVVPRVHSRLMLPVNGSGVVFEQQRVHHFCMQFPVSHSDGNVQVFAVRAFAPCLCVVVAHAAMRLQDAGRAGAQSFLLLPQASQLGNSFVERVGCLVVARIAFGASRPFTLQCGDPLVHRLLLHGQLFGFSVLRFQLDAQVPHRLLGFYVQVSRKHQRASVHQSAAVCAEEVCEAQRCGCCVGLFPVVQKRLRLVHGNCCRVIEIQPASVHGLPAGAGHFQRQVDLA